MIGRASTEFPFIVFAGAGDDVIHPGLSLPITKLEFRVTDRETAMADVSVMYEIACEGAPTVEGTATIVGSRVLELGRAEIERCFPSLK